MIKKLKSTAAVVISALMIAESVPATPLSSSPAATFPISIASSLGYISDTYSPKPSLNAKPDIILVQDLHVNRAVQFAISGILKQLKSQKLISGPIAVEGATGPLEISEMQKFPDPAARKKISDYLVEQGEMPGPIHFAVTEGQGSLYGVETDSYYQANLDMFRRSYKGRTALLKEVEKIQAVLPRLKKAAATRENATILDNELKAVSELINNQVIPDELIGTLRKAALAAEHLKQVLPKESADLVVEPLSASVNFYSLALLRNEELFNNALTLRKQNNQKTTLIVAGGFHTEALAQECKRHGLSYAVVTPNLKHHDKVDERLYVERLMGRHLTVEQAQSGQNWAALMNMIMVANAAQTTGRLFRGMAMSAYLNLSWRGAASAVVLPVVCGAALGMVGCGKSPTQNTDLPTPGTLYNGGKIANTPPVEGTTPGMYAEWFGDGTTALEPVLQGRKYRVYGDSASRGRYGAVQFWPRGSAPATGIRRNIENPSGGPYSFFRFNMDERPYFEVVVNWRDFGLTSAADLANLGRIVLISGNMYGVPFNDPITGNPLPNDAVHLVRIELLDPSAKLNDAQEKFNAAKERYETASAAIRPGTRPSARTRSALRDARKALGDAQVALDGVIAEDQAETAAGQGILVRSADGGTLLVSNPVSPGAVGAPIAGTPVSEDHPIVAVRFFGTDTRTPVGIGEIPQSGIPAVMAAISAAVLAPTSAEGLPAAATPEAVTAAVAVPAAVPAVNLGTPEIGQQRVAAGGTTGGTGVTPQTPASEKRSTLAQRARLNSTLVRSLVTVLLVVTVMAFMGSSAEAVTPGALRVALPSASPTPDMVSSVLAWGTFATAAKYMTGLIIGVAVAWASMRRGLSALTRSLSGTLSRGTLSMNAFSKRMFSSMNDRIQDMQARRALDNKNRSLMKQVIDTAA